VTLTAPGPCGHCGENPARGFASVNDEWYCHGDLDPDPTCYMLAQRQLIPGRMARTVDLSPWRIVRGDES
jgi:hypothetical protein